MPSPEAIGAVKEKHIRTLERRLRFLEACVARCPEDRGISWDMAEIAALKAVIADWKEHNGA